MGEVAETLAIGLKTVYMDVYMYIHIYIYTYTTIQLYMYTYMYTYTYIYTYIYTYTYTLYTYRSKKSQHVHLRMGRQHKKCGCPIAAYCNTSQEVRVTCNVTRHVFMSHIRVPCVNCDTDQEIRGTWCGSWIRVMWLMNTWRDSNTVAYMCIRAHYTHNYTHTHEGMAHVIKWRHVEGLFGFVYMWIRDVTGWLDFVDLYLYNTCEYVMWPDYMWHAFVIRDLPHAYVITVFKCLNRMYSDFLIRDMPHACMWYDVF